MDVQRLMDGKITHDGRLLRCHSQAKGKSRVPLLEKAYARYLGCHEQQQLCSLSDALVDLTGEAADIVELFSGSSRDPGLRVALIAKMMAPGNVRSLFFCAISVEYTQE